MNNKFSTKYIIILIIIAGITATVSSLITHKICVSNKQTLSEAPMDSIGQDTIVKTQVLRFKYNEQEYIEFVRDGSSYIVHDPDYNTLRSKLNNITTVINNNTNTEVRKLDQNDRANFRIIIDKLTKLEKEVAYLKTNNKKQSITKKSTKKKK